MLQLQPAPHTVTHGARRGVEVIPGPTQDRKVANLTINNPRLKTDHMYWRIVYASTRKVDNLTSRCRDSVRIYYGKVLPSNRSQ